MTTDSEGGVEITLAGKSYTMKPTLDAILTIEHVTGDGVMAIAGRVANGKVGLGDVAAIVTAGLRADGEPATYEKVCEMIVNEGIKDVIPIVADVLSLALSGTMKKEEQPSEKSSHGQLESSTYEQ